MKKVLAYISIFAISLFIISSCGSQKKEEPKEIKVEKKAETKVENEEKEENEENEAMETKVEVNENEEKEETVKTELGNAPKAEESKLEMKKEIDNSKTPMKCQITSLSNAVLQNTFTMMGKKLAKQMVAKGKILVVVNQKGKIYFVYNQDGSFASKKLAKYAANQYIGIIGKRKKINGVNIIIAEMIESMD